MNYVIDNQASWILNGIVAYLRSQSSIIYDFFPPSRSFFCDNFVAMAFNGRENVKYQIFSYVVVSVWGTDHSWYAVSLSWHVKELIMNKM